MAEQSGFFDAHLINGVYDRVYLADNFAKYFASFIGNGIFGGKSNELMVQQKATADMSVRVLSGQGWINGYWYENTSELSLDISVADGVLNRIDLIVLRWDNSERVIRLAVKKGTPASIPSAPTLQRSADYYELKLAEITINAGTTKITQANILDTRLNTAVCGLVHAVVDQFDSSELGTQMDAYISEFITDMNAWHDEVTTHVDDWIAEFQNTNNAWFSQFKTNSNSAVNTLITENQAKIDKLLSDGQTSINNVVDTGKSDIAKVVSDGTTNINNLIETKGNELDNLYSTHDDLFTTLYNTNDDKLKSLHDTHNTSLSNLKTEKEAELNQIVEEFNTKLSETDAGAINERLDGVDNEIEALKVKVEESSGMGIEDEVETGCYYIEAADGSKEWINPSNKFDTEYRLTERWNGKPIYQKTVYVAALSNKIAMSVHIAAAFDKIISITGFALDTDNNMYYPFPIIINGLEPVAVISGAVGDGGTESDITITVNEDLSAFKAYITVKYTKE